MPYSSSSASLIAPMPKQKVATFYINRGCDASRRLALEQRLAGAGIDAVRVEAIEGLNVPNDLTAYFFEGGALCSDLSPGEVGCYASHLRVYQLLIEQELPWALVLEDDATFASNVADDIAAILAAAPEDWSLIHLCGDNRRGVRVLRQVTSCHSLVRFSRIPAGAAGYLISRAGAERMLVPKIRYWPIDTDFRRPWHFRIQVFGVQPKLFAHDEASSTIGPATSRSRGRRGLRLPSKSSWTGNPLHCPEGAAYNIKALGIWPWLSCCASNLQRHFGRKSRAGAAPQA